MSKHHDILDVKPDASKEEIKKAYRKKVKLLHPDRNRDDPEAENKLKEVNLAYEALTNPKPEENIWTSHNTQGGWQRMPDQNIQHSVEIPYDKMVSGGEITISLAVPTATTGSPLSMMFSIRQEPLTFTVPPNSPVGKRIRLTKEQHGIDGFNTITLALVAEPHYDADTVISRSNVHKRIKVSAFDVLLGNPVWVPLPHGGINVRLPRSIGEVGTLPMEGRGLTDVRGRAGDLILEVKLVIPSLSDEKREKIREIMNDPA